MATKKGSSWEHDQGGQFESIMSVAAGCLAQKGVEALFDAITSDDDDDLPLKGAEKILCKTLSVAAGGLAQKGVEMIFEELISKDDDDDLPLKGAEKILCKTLSVAAGCLAQKGVEALFKELTLKEESRPGLSYRDKSQKPFCADAQDARVQRCPSRGFFPAQAEGEETKNQPAEDLRRDLWEPRTSLWQSRMARTPARELRSPGTEPKMPLRF
ncbi:uncharacterized protein VK521_006498 isoform 1-T2 [Ammospiza maritima maritima]